ncbi:MAG: prenyltransferase/squalene oxidase repeat-containing protein, partial [Candidatus Methanofastidiosia archaeon]
EAEIFKKTLEFLFRIQGKDGSWDESQKVLRYNPPSWDTPGELKNKMWITAEVTNLLIEASYKNSFEVKKACDFLISNREEDGKFFGYKITTWISIPIFKNLEREDIFENSLRLAREWIDEENDAAFINWYLECLSAAKISKKDFLFKKCLKKLAELQKENGSWSSVDGKRYTVSTTLNALKFLLLSKK